MECVICEKKHEQRVIYENDDLKIMLAIDPSASGHIQIFPHEHYTILEQVPDEVIARLMSAANKVSMLLFEFLKVHGTNIIIRNGVPAGQRLAHFCIDIIPRRSDDNLKLDWTLKPASQESLDNIQRIIVEGMAGPRQIEVLEKHEPAKTVHEEEKRQEIVDSESPREKSMNYYHKLLERIP